MDPKVQRANLVMQYHSFVSILMNAGVPVSTVTDDDLEKMPLIELHQLVRELRDIARTPRG